MNSTRILTLLGFVMLPVTVCASGCGSSGDDSSSGSPVGGGTEAGTRPIDGGNGNPNSGSSDAGSGSDAQTDESCSQMSSTTACITCCANIHPSSYLTFIDAIVNCECTSEAGTGVCQSQCANEYCSMNNPTPGDSCDTCLSDSLQADAGGRCLQPVAAACPMGGPCDPYLLCANNCP